MEQAMDVDDEVCMGEEFAGATAETASFINEARERYREYAQMEHGSVVNPITGEEVDIMQQCVNLQLDTGSDHEVGDTDAYREVVTDFAEQLTQGMAAWVVLSNGQYRKGRINRVNVEDRNTVTYDFEYSKRVVEGGKTIEKMFIIKDLARSCIKTQQLLVKGDPAGGKTTFAKQLLTWVLRNEESKWLVPVLIRTVDLVRCQASFIEDGTGMVDQYLAMHYAEIGLYKLFQEARAANRLMIILDGFDEAGASERQLMAEIKDRLIDDCFIVLTSREMGSTFEKSAFERFRSVRVKELNEDQQLHVIQRRLHTTDRVNSFRTQLTLNPALGHMAKNPLLLNVTLAVFESCNLNEEASINRGKVYSIALDGMLGSIEKAKGSDIPMTESAPAGHRSISAKALRSVLKQVAFLAHTQRSGSGIRDFRRDLIEQAVRTSGVGAEFTMDHWNDIEDIIKKGRLPVLTWFTEEGEDTFRFAHLTFQEFLCAEQCLQLSVHDEEFILDWKQIVCPNFPREIISRGWWQQTLQMYCDLARSSGLTSKSGKCLSTVLGETFFGLAEDSDCSLDFPEGVNDNNILTLVSMLQMNTSLEHMSLGKEVSSRGISTIQSLRLSSLQSLTLRGNQIGPDGCLSIALFMESGASPLQVLDLSNNIICQGQPKADMPPRSGRNVSTGHYNSHLVDFRGFSALLRLMRDHATLREVDFRGNFLNLEAGRMLSEVVLANERLERVCGIPVKGIRTGGLTEIEFENRAYFILINRTPERFLSTGDAELLLELLLQFPQPLQRLVLHSQALASDMQGVVQLFSKLGEVVAAANELYLLDVSGFWDCGAAAGKALGQKIKDHPALKRIQVGTGALDMTNIRMTGKGSTDLPEMLSVHGVQMRDCGAGILSECLPRHIPKLDVRRTGIGASGYKLLSQCAHLEEINGIELKNFTQACSSLDLSMKPLNSSGAVACIIARTALTPNLTYLDLSHSNFTSKCHIHKLAPVVGGRCSTGCDGGCDVSNFAGTNAYMNCSECDLDFCSTCCMSECPMVSLAEAIQRLPQLSTLKLSRCSFEGGVNGPVRSHNDQESYQILGVALSKHQKLTELDISENYFEGPGFPHLARGIAQMPELRTLHVANHKPENFRQWLEAEEIEVKNSSEAVLLILSMAIKRNPNLRRLDWRSHVERTDVTLRVVRALTESLVTLQHGVNDEVHESIALHSLEMTHCSFNFLQLQEAGADATRISPYLSQQSSTETSRPPSDLQREQSPALLAPEPFLPPPPESASRAPRSRRVRTSQPGLTEGLVRWSACSVDSSSQTQPNELVPRLGRLGSVIEQEAYAPLFALAIRVGKSLVEIDLRNWEFRNETKSIVSAVQSLARHGVLQRYNGIPLHLPQDVQVLNLEQKPVMSHGISVLATVTLASSNIRQLDVSRCNMDASSLGTLLKSIQLKQTVTLLDISHTPLGRQGVEELASFLRADKKLQELRARRVALPVSRGGVEMLSFATALESNVTLATLDIRENNVEQPIAERLRRTMEEKRKVVPLPLELKYCFLLCNRHLPDGLRLPEVEQVPEVSILFSDGCQSPLALIFQYCARPRELLLDKCEPAEPAFRRGEWERPPPQWNLRHVAGEASDSDEDFEPEF